MSTPLDDSIDDLHHVLPQYTRGGGGRETSHTIALGIWSIVLHSYIDVEQAVLVNVGFGKRAWKRCQAGQKRYEADDVQHRDQAVPVDVAQKE